MKTALVTGGAGGIGSAICTGLARAGCQVAVHYNTKKETAEALAAQLQKSCGIKAIAVQADIKDRESVNRMFDKVDKSLGGVDILVNNAGIAQQKLFTDLTYDDWRAMLDTNLSGVFNCSQEALRRHMLPVHSGVILNISSMWGQVGASCEVHYSAAKAGVIGLTKALAKEVGLSGVRVNCIAPGVIMTDNSAERPRHAEGHSRRSGVPLLRQGEVHHGTGSRGERRIHNLKRKRAPDLGAF